MYAGETNVDAEEVGPAAARLAVRAGSLKGKLADYRSQLRGLNGCWGSDEAGRAFEESYYGPGGTPGDNAADDLVDGCHTVCESIEAFAENAGVSAYYSQYEDEMTHEEIMAAQQEQVEEYIDALAEAGEGAGTGENGGAALEIDSPRPEPEVQDAPVRATHPVAGLQASVGADGSRMLSTGGPWYRATGSWQHAVTPADHDHYLRDAEKPSFRLLGADGGQLSARRELASQLQDAIEQTTRNTPAPPIMGADTDGAGTDGPDGAGTDGPDTDGAGTDGADMEISTGAGADLDGDAAGVEAEAGTETGAPEPEPIDEYLAPSHWSVRRARFSSPGESAGSD